MKDLFKGYNKKTEKELKEIWNNSIFVFDTNVLLNLYRYSPDTRNSIINLIQHFEDRIILPHQVAWEYNKNRYEVIANNESLLKKFLTNLQNVHDEINSQNQHPFLSSTLQKNTEKLFKNIKEEAVQNQQEFQKYYNEDPIYNKISDLFDGKISDEFSVADLEIIFKEGEKRYASKIPPGFEDTKKTENKFGDLIIWKQIIEISKKNKSNIILITEDQKKDWYWILETDGKKMGPHPKLVEEFFKLTSFDFHIFTTKRFLQLGEEFSNVKPSKDAVEEIEATIKFTDSNVISYNELFHEQAKSTFDKGKSFENLKIYSRLHDLSKINDRSLKYLEFYKNLQNIEEAGKLHDFGLYKFYDYFNNEIKRKKKDDDDEPETDYALAH